MAGAIVLAAFCGDRVFADLQLTENGKTEYRIMLGRGASDNLKYAAHELKIHLEEASGAKFPVVKESAGKTDREIVLNEKDPKLETGEFLVRTEGKRLYLSGGGESGIHHAVHDFLETDCGYIWYDARGGKKIPDMKNFTLRETSRRKKYPFDCRNMTADYFFNRPEGHYFLYRNGMNMKTRHLPLPGMKEKPKIRIGVNDVRCAIPLDHNILHYIPPAAGKSRIKVLKTKGYFKDHPEYFTLMPNGKRAARQLCFSNAGLRAEFRKNFYEHIRNTPDMNIFSVTLMDLPGALCSCADCKAAVKKYKTNGAPVFLFVKELAEAVKKDFPGIRIWTYAYRKDQTEKPPEGLKFPDNVIIDFCPIDDDMSKGLDYETNAGTYRNLKRWKECCADIWVGYYVNPWTYNVTIPPLGNVHRCARDIVLIRKAGATGIHMDQPVGTPNMTGFIELQNYLTSRLLRNPDLDIDALIRDFMEFEYGPAAPLMKKYLDELETVTSSVKTYIKWSTRIGALAPIFKSRDVVRWQKYFDEMEKLTAGDPVKNFSVRRVRLPLDLTTLNFFRRIRKEVPEYDTDVKTLASRIRKNYFEATGTFYAKNDASIQNWRKNHNGRLDVMVKNLSIKMGTEPKPLPREIFGGFKPELIYEFFPGAMRKTRRVPDPQAAWNYALLNTDAGQGFPIQFLEYDPVKDTWNDFSKIQKAKTGMEGKYAFYHIGKIDISPNLEMRIHFKGYKHLFNVFAGEVWMPGTDDTVNIYASLKFTGPKYYPGSKEKDSVACDRIVFVRKTNE